MSVNSEVMVNIIPIYNKINFWKSFWLELAGIPRRIVPPPGRESKMLSKLEVAGIPHVRGTDEPCVRFKGLATQAAAHISTVLVHCGEHKYSKYPMSG